MMISKYFLKNQKLELNVTKLKILNNSLHLSFNFPCKHKATPVTNSLRSIKPFYKNKKNWIKKQIPEHCSHIKTLLSLNGDIYDKI